MAGFNNVVLMGRLTRDPNISYYEKDGKQICLARYTLAVERKFGEGANFINCQAFGKRGEFAEKYLKQGTQILIRGELETGSYENKNGKKVYTWAVNVTEHIFTGTKNEAENTESTKTDDDGFTSIPETIDNAGDTPNLPFEFNY